MARLYDISVTVNADTPPWPEDTPFSCKWTWMISRGASVNVSAITSSPHVGTHADAPFHVNDGWPGAHELDLDSFTGPVTVADVSGLGDVIEAPDLESATGSFPETVGMTRRLLLKTGRTVAQGSFPEGWPAVSESCARALLGHGLRLLGTDAPSVDSRESKALAVHRMLFSGNANILENLDLRRIQPGRYELFAFPQKLMAADAAPVRAVLRKP